MRLLKASAVSLLPYPTTKHIFTIMAATQYSKPSRSSQKAAVATTPAPAPDEGTGQLSDLFSLPDILPKATPESTTSPQCVEDTSQTSSNTTTTGAQTPARVPPKPTLKTTSSLHCVDSLSTTSSNTTTSGVAPPTRSVLGDNHDLRGLLGTLYRNTLHLGNPELLQHVQWIQSGKHYLLVQKDQDQDNTEYQPAVIQCIGELDPETFWLYACGGWSGQSGPNKDWATPTFDKAKARAQLRLPAWLEFDSTWQAYLHNLENIVQMPLPGIKDTPPVALSIRKNDNVALRHSVFLVCALQKFILSLF
jgi:hypothetical protein